ncbi:DUF4392 domain-containing protein [Jutongia huaianensis]|uniref:DUF4392 domain-containing protein n=1 Tax=Jutongia huaianensis TaxID=2763668 RepID=A0ABR7N403_9FIRM|nr:DUF4392 domain-containing protein [Jutongia huaianensis]MBC8562748.1 DUF4392 domain-containing protein [Jutongia huaianensis]
MNKGTPEEVTLRYSKRGMTLLKEYLQKDYCKMAAEKLLQAPKGNVLITTGFYVAGYAETDGPIGTLAVAKALEGLGYHGIVITDKYCEGFFELKNISVEYVAIDADQSVYEEILEKYRPVYMISIERCGHNLENEYANMRGDSITGQTACIDTLFELAAEKKIPTIGVGDGGNEIGMGNVRQVILEKLELNPCVVTVDDLIIATTSNWGAYALAAYMAKLSGRPVFITYEEIEEYMAQIVALGCVDGVTKQRKMGTDGFSMEIEKEIITSLKEAIA